MQAATYNCTIEANPKKKSNKNYAGTWRAWVRMQSFGASGKPCLHDLAVEYRAAMASMSPAFVQAQELAAVAKGSKHVGNKKLWAQNTNSQETSCIATEGAPLQDARKVTRRHLLMGREQTKLDKVWEQQVLEDVQSHSGLVHLNELQVACPAIPLHMSDLTCIPCDNGSAFWWCNVNRKVAKGMAHAIAKSGLLMHQEWMERHAIVTETDATPLPPVKAKKSLCRTAGFCV
eukprot:5535090-Amphidinium_carterae.2